MQGKLVLTLALAAAFAAPVHAAELNPTEQRIVAGFAIGEEYPELGDALLVCATETRTDDDIETFARALEAVL